MKPVFLSLTIAVGIWRAVLFLPDGELPFNFELKKVNAGYEITIINGEEKIKVDEITLTRDSLFARLPVYDSEIRVKIDNATLKGEWKNYSRKTNQSIPFEAVHGLNYRFKPLPGKFNPNNISGRWETDFSPGTKDSAKAIGVFNLEADYRVTGTFLTPSGDYRFLEGIFDNDSLFLSCFDGAFAYLFKARVTGNKMDGVFLSGNHWKTSWAAIRNELFELPNPDSMTFLKPGSERIAFTFPDLDSNLVSFSDEQFKNKVVVIQIMGSWCPNCLDETNFLVPFYNQYYDKGFEVIGLSFEKTDDFQKAASLVKRLQQRLQVKYTLLIAGDRQNISTALPMINRIMGYPTTLFIDKKGRVRKIHTGFSGPATGGEYEKFKDDFTAFIEKLLGEK